MSVEARALRLLSDLGLGEQNVGLVVDALNDGHKEGMKDMRWRVMELIDDQSPDLAARRIRNKICELPVY